MKKFLFGLLFATLIILLCLFVVDASAAETSGAHYVELDLPLVDYLNYDEFFAAQCYFEETKSLQAISNNLAKVVGCSDGWGCGLQIYSDRVFFVSAQKNGYATLDFADLEPGEYTLRYYVKRDGETRYAAFRWRLSESEEWFKDSGTWLEPVTFRFDEGDHLQVELYNYNGLWHKYYIWFYIVPSTVSTEGMYASQIMEEPFYNQIGNVYHVGQKYYQVQHNDYSDYYMDFSILKDLGPQIVTPDSDYYYYKIYKTRGDRWRILWRDAGALTNPLIYENGFFYVNEPAGAYYSSETYDTISHALLALTSEKTEYTFDAIRRYENAFSYDAMDFFDPSSNEIFWNVYSDDVYPAEFYQKLNPEHYNELGGASAAAYHWQLPSVFSFQNYTEEYTAIPIEMSRISTFGFFGDVGSFFYDTYNNVTGWVSSTATKVYCKVEKVTLQVKSFFVDGKEEVVSGVQSAWQSTVNGAQSFITGITGGSGTVYGEIRDVVMTAVKESLGLEWLDGFRDMFEQNNDPFRDIMLFFKDKFSFISDVRAIIERIVSVFDKNARAVEDPPVIYADFSESESVAFQGVGQVAVVDFSWYARYKPYVDTFLSAILWGFFMFRLYFRLPDIIAGTGSFFEAGQKSMREV